MLHAFPFPDELRSRNRLAVMAQATGGDVTAIDLFAEGLQALDRFGLQTAEYQFLDAPGQPAFQE